MEFRASLGVTFGGLVAVAIAIAVGDRGVVAGDADTGNAAGDGTDLQVPPEVPIQMPCINDGEMTDLDVNGPFESDCNENGQADYCDILIGVVEDINENGVPDTCEVDCNANSVPDDHDLTTGDSWDLNGNLVPDECEIATSPFSGIPARDDCVDAELICPGFTYTSSTVGATFDGVLTCGEALGLFDVWYRYEPDWDGDVVIDTCSSELQATISVYGGCPPAVSNLVACSDFDCGLAFSATRETGYLIRVAGLGGTVGSFQMTLDAPPCPQANSRVTNAIKYSSSPQPETTTTMLEFGIDMLPMAYNPDIDFDADGVFEPYDRFRLANWIDNNVPDNYSGPVCLDYENPYWFELAAAEITPHRLQEIMDVYIEILTFAKSQRPNARFGFWGMPLLRNTIDDNWLGQGNSITPVLMAGDAVFPTVYDCTPGDANLWQQEEHISRTLEFVAGRRPVFVFVWNYYCGQDELTPVPIDEFISTAGAALNASWVDSTGHEHRIAGMSLWDTFHPNSTGEVDALHAELLESLHDLVENGPSVFGSSD